MTPVRARNAPARTARSRPVPRRLGRALARPSGRVRAWVARHRTFTAVLALAAAVRAAVMLGYPSGLWFDDSFEYLGVALRPYPYPIRPDGYPLLLRLLEPFHSFGLVVALQHLMGLAVGTAVYLVLRRHGPFARTGGPDGRGPDGGGLPGWGAAVVTAPVLLDANIVALEQSILSDTLFTFLLTMAAAVVLWRSTVTVPAAATAGLLVAAATLTRSAGLPLLAIVLGYLVLRRVRWTAVAATALAGAVPLVSYAVWFHAHHGEYALTTSSGVILWSRTAPFADCRVIRPPAPQTALCPSRPPEGRAEPTAFLWSDDSPLAWVGGRRAVHRADRFATGTNRLAGDLARRAIVAQPGDYLAATGLDLGRTFAWGIKFHSEPVIYNMYEFPDLEGTLPKRAEIPGGTFHGDLRAYAGGDEPGVIRTRIVEPYAGAVRTYQHLVWLPGFGIAALLLVALAGAARGLRRAGRRAGRGGEVTALLPVAMASALLVVPVLVAGYGPRYRLAAIPLVCLAAGIALRRLRRRPARTGEPAPPAAETAGPGPAGPDREPVVAEPAVSPGKPRPSSPA